VALNGGTLAVGGAFTDTVGSLSLLSNSTLNFLGNTSTLTFANATRAGGVLTIDNWSGNPFGAGNSQLVFTNAATGFTGGGSLLNEITFSGYARRGHPPCFRRNRAEHRRHHLHLRTHWQR